MSRYPEFSVVDVQRDDVGQGVMEKEAGVDRRRLEANLFQIRGHLTVVQEAALGDAGYCFDHVGVQGRQVQGSHGVRVGIEACGQTDDDVLLVHSVAVECGVFVELVGDQVVGHTEGDCGLDGLGGDNGCARLVKVDAFLETVASGD